MAPRIIAKSELLELPSIELTVAGVFSDSFPFLGVLGLLDWRWAGKLSALRREGQISGEAGETVLAIGRQKAPFERALVIGMGRQESFSQELFASTLSLMTAQLTGLSARNPVVELPGRSEGLLSPLEALEWTSRLKELDLAPWRIYQGGA